MSESETIPHSKPWITPADGVAVSRVMSGNMLSQGELTRRFEQAVSSALRVCDGVACASGTSALVLTLLALEIGDGDEVVLPTYVCRDVYESVLSVGAVPVLCDIGESPVITPESVRRRIGPRSRAVIAVHTFGYPADVAALMGLGLPVIEDASQAFGLQIDGKPAGSIGVAGVLSFNATKCFTTGEGGMLVGEREVVDRARNLRDGGEQYSTRYPSRFSDIQAALGLSQLDRYDQFISRRVELAKFYERELAGFFSLPPLLNQDSFLFRYTLSVDADPQQYIRLLENSGISARRGVDELLHRNLGLNDADYRNATERFKTTLSIPFYPALSDQEALKITRTLLDINREH